MRVCSGAGCLRAVPDDVRFCDECKPIALVADQDIKEHSVTDRERYASLYSGSRWQRLRDRVVREQPLCARCELHISEIVDHKIPAGVAIAQARDSGRFFDRFAGFFLRSNLQGLCRGCHYTKTIEDKAHVGEWPNVLNYVCAVRKWTF